MLPDPRTIPPDVRQQIAVRARQAHDAVAFTNQLVYFNTAPCSRHREQPSDETQAMVETAAPVPACPDCGIILRRHQRTGATWLWFAMRGLLADSCGLGKTAQIGAVLAMALQTGELGNGNRAVVVCQAAAVRQWQRELVRMVPALGIICADGSPDDRMRAYLGPWDVCVISDRTLSPAGRAGTRNARDGDVERLRQFPVGIVVYDDIDAMRNGKTKAAWAVKRLASTAERVYGLHATPLQKRLIELYHFTEPVGSIDVFGTPATFRSEYVARQRILLWLPVNKALPHERNTWARKKDYPSYSALESRARSGDPAAQRLIASVRAGRARFQRPIWKDSGVNERRLPEFKRLIAPMILRRTVRDLDDVTLPDVQTNEVWLDLLPRQRERMAELQRGILHRLRNSGEEITRVQAAAAFTRARQICSGLAALDDAGEEAQAGNESQRGNGLLPGDVSVKLDWAVDRITGDLSEDKVFCFVYFKQNVLALSRRLEAEGVDHVLLWSNETDPAERDRRVQRFTHDADCRVVIATTTAERSLNLQAANHVMAVDSLQNPARMEQIIGRARRMGSRHTMVLFHQLLIRDSYEETLLELLRSEQALANAVWDDESPLFISDMSPRQLMAMIAGVAA